MPLAKLEDSLESPPCSPAVAVTPALSSGTKVTKSTWEPHESSPLPFTREEGV